MTDMYYRDGGNWVDMPYWAVSYFNIGASLAGQSNDKYRFVVGLALPVRAYAAPLIATGIVVARAKLPVIRSDASDYLEYLKTVAVGTKVLFTQGDNCYTGEFLEVRQSEGQPLVWIIWKRGKQECNCGLSLTEARKRLQIISNLRQEADKKVAGRRLVHNKEFIKAILDGINPTEFVLQTRLECIILGSVNTLRREIKDQQISIGAKHTSGTMQDVLRVKKYLADGSTYRSNVTPASRELNSQTENSEIPYATIFDGAISFLKWRDYWRKSNWVVLLDKTEACFLDAVDQLNKEYIEKRIPEGVVDNIPGIPAVPAGVELLMFQESMA